MIEASLECIAPVAFPAPAGHGDEYRPFAGGGSADGAGDLETGFARHADIEQHRMWFEAVERRERRLAVVGDVNHVAVHAQQRCEAVGRIDVVVGYQHAQACALGPRHRRVRGGRPVLPAQRARRRRKVNREFAATSRAGAARREPPTMQLDESAGHGKSDSKTAL